MRLDNAWRHKEHLAGLWFLCVLVHLFAVLRQITAQVHSRVDSLVIQINDGILVLRFANDDGPCCRPPSNCPPNPSRRHRSVGSNSPRDRCREERCSASGTSRRRTRHRSRRPRPAVDARSRPIMYSTADVLSLPGLGLTSTRSELPSLRYWPRTRSGMTSGLAKGLMYGCQPLATKRFFTLAAVAGTFMSVK